MHLRALLLSSFTASAAIGQTLNLDLNGSSSGFGSGFSVSWESPVWTADSFGSSFTNTWTQGASAVVSSSIQNLNTLNIGTATDVQLASLSLNRALSLTSTGGGALTRAGNLTITGNANVTISAPVRVGTNQLTVNGSSTTTLSGVNTIGALLKDGTGTVKAGHVDAFGSGTITNQGGTIDFNGLDVAPRLVTGYVRGDRMLNGQAYTGTIYANAAGQMLGNPGENPSANGIFPLANHVLTSTSFLRYQTSGTVTLDHADSLVNIASYNGSPVELGSLTVNAGSVFTNGWDSLALDTLRVNGDLVLNDGNFTAFDGSLKSGSSRLFFSINGATSSHLIVTGTAYLAGTLMFDVWQSPGAETTYDLINASSFVGAFDSVTLPTVAGFEWDTSQLNTAGRISLVAVPEPSAFAALSGLIALSLATLRRRRA